MSAAQPNVQKTRLAPVMVAVLVTLAGCASPTVQAPASEALQRAQVPTQWAVPVPSAAAADAPALAWRDWLRQPRLVEWVNQALQHNRDLRVAVLNVQRAQAQLTVADASRWPTLGAGLGYTRAPNSKGQEANTFTGGLQVNAWELDLFGRLASLTEAAQAQWLSSEAGRRAAELALVASVVQAGLALQADEELLTLARQTLDSRAQSLKLTELRESVGASSQLELQAQRSLLAQAQANWAQLSRQQAQDRNALALLVGQPVLKASAGAALSSETWMNEVPVGLPSQVLLRRPDVIAAEQTLRGAQANIGAARAAFWPSVTLTGQAGQASPQLSGLFQGGNFVYTLVANAVLTVFDSGRRQANVDAAVASQQIAQAQYERAIQAAFRETADALAGVATWRDQLAALRVQLAAARETARLTDLKASQGAASVLEQLEAQRALWQAEQAVVQTRLAELNNRVALFKALGG
jgi:NodT family efflux transporter outer membrane factor (OMF) lipoprotein